jgi:predicted dienelactone hydrolase
MELPVPTLPTHSVSPFGYVRAVHTAVAVPGEAPYDRAHLKVFYPSGVPGSTAAERGSGMVAAAPGGPFPVAVLCNPVNIGSEFHRWIAVALARRGIVCATYSWVSSAGGFDVLIPGLPGADPLHSIVAGLTRLNDMNGPLEGQIDTSQVIVGGHSAGGSVALLAADHERHPSVCGVFALAAHQASLGTNGPTFAPLGCGVPVFLAGGSRDGVIDRSRHRYNVADGGDWDPVRRTFEESLASLDGRHAYALVDGANHFSFTEPDDDPTVGRAFLDHPATTPGSTVRTWAAAAIGAFAACALGDEAARLEFEELLKHPLVTVAARR